MEPVLIARTLDGDFIYRVDINDFDGLFINTQGVPTVIDLRNFLFKRQDVSKLEVTAQQKAVWKELLKLDSEDAKKPETDNAVKKTRVRTAANEA